MIFNINTTKAIISMALIVIATVTSTTKAQIQLRTNNLLRGHLPSRPLHQRVRNLEEDPTLGMTDAEQLAFLVPIAEEYISSIHISSLDDDDIYTMNNEQQESAQLLQMVAVMMNRPDTSPEEEMVGIASIPCEVSVVIDVIALGLGAIGLRGNAPKNVGKKLWHKTPAPTKTKILHLLPTMTAVNFPAKLVEVLKLIYEELSWNTLNDSFAELGWWDALTFSLAFIAIFAGGGVPFLINVGLLVADIAMLLVAINDCFL